MKIDPLIIDRAKRVDISSLFKAAGIERQANGKYLCPFHDEKTPSMSINRGENHFYCFGCGAGGDPIRFLQDYEGMDFVDAIDRLTDEGLPVLSKQDLAQAEAVQEKAFEEKLVRSREKASNFMRQTATCDQGRDGIHPVARYLFSRGLNDAAYQALGGTLPGHLRIMPECPYYDAEGTLVGHFPALIAIISDNKNRPIAYEVRWLSADKDVPDNGKNSCKAPVTPNKKIHGMLSFAYRKNNNRGSIKLGDWRQSDTIAVCEGLETGLFIQSHHDLPVMCTCSAANIPKLWLPKRDLVIFSDKGGVGEEAAELLKARHNKLYPDRIVRIRVPEGENGDDALDEYMAKKSQLKNAG